MTEEVIAYRARHGLTQDQFATLCRVSPKTIWRVENGKSVLRTTEAKITEVLYRNTTRKK